MDDYRGTPDWETSHLASDPSDPFVIPSAAVCQYNSRCGLVVFVMLPWHVGHKTMVIPPKNTVTLGIS